MDDDLDQFLRDITGTESDNQSQDAASSFEYEQLLKAYRKSDDPAEKFKLQAKLIDLLKKAKGRMCAVLGLLILALYPAQASAQAFTNKDFLELPEIQQKGFIDGAMQTLYQMAAQESIETGQCVHDWYYGDKRTKRNWLILRSMEKYPDNRPPAILAALTERACGRYIRREE